MNAKSIRNRVSFLAIVCAIGAGLAGCATIGAVQSGTTITAADVQNDAVAACGYLPSAETASNLIQAATQTAGSNTATTDAAYTALAEQLAQLACSVAKASTTTASTATSTTTAPAAKALRSLRRKLGTVSIAPGYAYVGSPPVAVAITGAFQ